jgi:hypothetical protein
LSGILKWFLDFWKISELMMKIKVKYKGEVHPRTGHQGPEGE